MGQKDLLEKGMATYSSTLAWRMPWTEEPGGLQSIGSQRLRRLKQLNAHVYYTVLCNFSLNNIMMRMKKVKRLSESGFSKLINSKEKWPIFNSSEMNAFKAKFAIGKNDSCLPV